jgi:hypothetical protein
LKTGIVNGLFCTTVPVAIGCKEPVKRRYKVLYKRGNTALRTYMLHHQELAPWLENTPDFLQATQGIVYRAED